MILLNFSTIIFTHSSPCVSNLKGSFADTLKSSKISLTGSVVHMHQFIYFLIFC